MPGTIGYLLDTNILLVALIRGNPLGQYINARYNLQSDLSRSLVSIVSVGELLALGRGFGWGEQKLNSLQNLLEELVWIDISAWDILEAYGDIYETCSRSGKSLEQNDIWIAATAKVTGAVLLTTDKDFDHLHGTHLTRIWIDPKTQ